METIFSSKEVHIRVWRLAIVASLVVSFLGTWVFDTIYVPARYPCKAPVVRIRGDLCGLPMSGVAFYRWMVGGFIRANTEFSAGALDWSELGPDFLLVLLLLSLVIPIVSTLFLTLYREPSRLQFIHILILGLTAVISLLLGLSSRPAQFWMAWGIWLYVATVAIALVLEILLLSKHRKIP